MDGPSPPIGMFAKIGLWLLDAFRAPGRIKVIAEGVALDRDPRPFCRSCGKGRVGSLTYLGGVTVSQARGVCDNCGVNFVVTNDGKLGQVLDPVKPHERAPGE